MAETKLYERLHREAFPERTLEEERLHRKRMLAATFRIFAKLGFDMGIAGHVTARDPEHTDCFWVNPFAVNFARIKVSDLLLVNHNGEVVHGDRDVNRAAFAIHSQVHAYRKDVVAAAHTHSTYGKTWSTLGRLLDPISQDACAFYNDHGLFNSFTGVVHDTKEGANIASALGQFKAVILQNHGLLTVGQSVEEAAWWFISMERACQSQLLAEAAGKPVPIEDRYAAITAKQQDRLTGVLSFRMLFEQIADEQPDLFD